MPTISPLDFFRQGREKTITLFLLRWHFVTIRNGEQGWIPSYGALGKDVFYFVQEKKTGGFLVQGGTATFV